MKRITDSDVERFGSLGGEDAWRWAIKAWRCRQDDHTSCRLASRYLRKAVDATKVYRGKVRETLGGSRFYFVDCDGEHCRQYRDRAAIAAWVIMCDYTGDWDMRLGHLHCYLRLPVARFYIASDPNRGQDFYRRRHRLRRMPARSRRHWQLQDRLLQSIADESAVSRYRHQSDMSLQMQDDNELRREGSRVY